MHLERLQQPARPALSLPGELAQTVGNARENDCILAVANAVALLEERPRHYDVLADALRPTADVHQGLPVIK